MRLIRVTAPAGDVVSLADAKAQLGVTDDSGDAALAAYLAAAIAWIDTGWFGRALAPQAWALTRQSFYPEDEHGVVEDHTHSLYRRHVCGHRWPALVLPFPPLISVDAITYVDPQNATQTLDPSLYDVLGIGDRGAVRPAFRQIWPRTSWRADSVTIRFTCGYSPVANVPAPIKQAIVLATSKLKSLASSDPSLKVDSVIGVSSQQWDVAGIKVYDAAIDALLADYRVFA